MVNFFQSYKQKKEQKRMAEEQLRRQSAVSVPATIDTRKSSVASGMHSITSSRRPSASTSSCAQEPLDMHTLTAEERVAIAMERLYGPQMMESRFSYHANGYDKLTI